MSSAAYTNSRKNESFVKLRSTCGKYNELDLHGMLWSERAVLEVSAFDRTNAKIVVKNCNGLTWVSDLKAMEFCTEEGNKICTN